MRTIVSLSVLAVLALVSAPVLAGNMLTTGGKAQWQSTNCKEPVEPGTLKGLHGESHAEFLNAKMESYNAYANRMQEYMNCVSKEAESDSTSTNQTISDSAQATIDAAQKKVSALHDSLQPKHKTDQ